MKAKDFRSTLEPVWCTGCGDFGVLKGLTTALADLEIAPERLAATIPATSFWPSAPRTNCRRRGLDRTFRR